MSEQPNVLLISTDHWPAHLLGSAGHPEIITPTLDTLAASGIRYTNCYSECPVCVPARRSLMTGLTPKGHGDRVFKAQDEFPNVPTLAQSFRDAGYQAFAVGKLHVMPQRDRIGFDEVILNEEGRVQFGVVDDYEAYLAEQGYPGQQFSGGMSNNEYCTRPWHLPDETHSTNWTAREMSRMIKRRDPRKPGFYFCSFVAPHPPLTPLRDYLAMYDDMEVPDPVIGNWSQDYESLPTAVKPLAYHHYDAKQRALAIKAFYAACTHIDHQLRVVIGTLSQEGLIDDTIIMFTSDHGDMLGDHRLWAKRSMYESSMNVPMILAGRPLSNRCGYNKTDDRLCGWADVMPTLLDLCGIEKPSHVEGLSMVGDFQRDYLYGECAENFTATRMIRKGDFKLVYYPYGNVTQLFNISNDPKEAMDLSSDDAYATILAELTEHLKSELYGSDEPCLQDGILVGMEDPGYTPGVNPRLSGQRGLHFPRP